MSTRKRSSLLFSLKGGIRGGGGGDDVDDEEDALLISKHGVVEDLLKDGIKLFERRQVSRYIHAYHVAINSHPFLFRSSCIICIDVAVVVAAAVIDVVVVSRPFPFPSLVFSVFVC